MNRRKPRTWCRGVGGLESQKGSNGNWKVEMHENDRRIITCVDDISEGIAFISSVEPRFRPSGRNLRESAAEEEA